MITIPNFGPARVVWLPVRLFTLMLAMTLVPLDASAATQAGETSTAKTTSAKTKAEVASPSADAAGKADLPVNSRFGKWVVACQAVTVSRNVCRLVQEQVRRDKGTLVARFVAQPSADGGAVFEAQVPMGAYLPGGAVYRLENEKDGKQHQLVWQRCLGKVCVAASVLSADEIKAMDAAGALLFGYRLDPRVDPVVTRVDMTDFVKGLDALR